MEAFRSDQQGRRKTDHWAVVRRWSATELREPAKLVWSYLYELAGGVECSIVVHAGNLGREIGTTERSARRALDSLAKVGLILIPEKLKGEISAFLNNPLKAAIARLSPGASSGQGELFPNEPEFPPEDEMDVEILPMSPGLGKEKEVNGGSCTRNVTADRAHDPPNVKGIYAYMPNTPINSSSKEENSKSARAQIEVLGIKHAPEKTGAAVHAHDPPPLSPELNRLKAWMKPAEFEDVLRIRRQQTFLERDEENRRGPVPLIKAVAEEYERAADRLQAQGSPAQRESRAEKLAALILEKVADPAMHKRKALHIARAIGDGLVPEQKLWDVLRRLESKAADGTLDGARGKYFNGSMKAIFKLLSIPWDDEKPKKDIE